MKLFVGLGNPWSKYALTRHNLGFLMIDELACEFGWTDFLFQKKYDADVATWMFWKHQIIVAKPQTFMNRSGKSVIALQQFYKIASKDVLIFHDDIDIDSGQIKLKYNGWHWGHNGIRDIYKHAWDTGYWRMKLWVWRPPHPDMDVSDYVLWKLWDDEIRYRQNLPKKLIDKIELYIKNTW